MADADTGDELPAGRFSSWLEGMQSALRGEAASDVACGTCTACCTSSQFIHVGPDEIDTLAHIPAELLSPAPGLPDGHLLLGYDQNGHCPMFRDGACSVYEHRPATCRTYDCRIFAATGVDVPVEDMPLIAQQAGRWRFEPEPDGDSDRHAAVRNAASYLAHNRDSFDNLVPANATRLAVLALKVHDTFLGTNGAGSVNPEHGAVEAALRRRP